MPVDKTAKVMDIKVLLAEVLEDHDSLSTRWCILFLIYLLQAVCKSFRMWPL